MHFSFRITQKQKKEIEADGCLETEPVHLELLPRQSPSDSSEQYTFAAGLLWPVVAY